MADDPKISQRYRELPREEPPRHLDDAILAAARRAADARPAPLVTPAGRRRWYFPLAAAAIIVLAVAVTMHVERERPDEEVAVAPVTAPKVPIDSEVSRSERAAERAKPSAKAEVFAPDPEPKPARPREQAPAAAADSRELRAQRDAPLAELQKAETAPASPAPPLAAPAPGPAPAQDAVSGMRESRRADTNATPQARLEVQGAMRQKASAERAASLATASPEQWLQGIDDLKRQGRHEEAERELAEFRKRYPDYRIPEAITEKFEKR